MTVLELKFALSCCANNVESRQERLEHLLNHSVLITHNKTILAVHFKPRTTSIQLSGDRQEWICHDYDVFAAAFLSLSLLHSQRCQSSRLSSLLTINNKRVHGIFGTVTHKMKNDEPKGEKGSERGWVQTARIYCRLTEHNTHTRIWTNERELNAHCHPWQGYPSCAWLAVVHCLAGNGAAPSQTPAAIHLCLSFNNSVMIAHTDERHRQWFVVRVHWEETVFTQPRRIRSECVIAAHLARHIIAVTHTHNTQTQAGL